jgi:hypothetical protein
VLAGGRRGRRAFELLTGELAPPQREMVVDVGDGGAPQMPSTNATSPSTITVFSWWQWNGCSRGSVSQRMRVSRVRVSTPALTSLRVGRNAGTGAPAHTSTLTSSRSAASASSSPRTPGRSPRISSK